MSQAARPDTTTANKALMRRYIEAINGQAKTEAMMREFTTDEALLEHVRAFEPAFPRYGIVVEDIIAEGDKVVVRGLGRGKHEGEFAGVAPTGKEVEFPVIIIYRIENEMIAEFWVQADMMSLMRQLTG